MRRAKPEDVSTLLKLARMVHFINLPADKDIIAEKVQWSRRCFAEVAQRRRADGSLPPETTATEHGRTGRAVATEAPSSRSRPDRRTTRGRDERASGGGGVGGDGTGGARRPASDADGHGRQVDRSRLFMFVLEDLQSGGVLGTSQIITNMGGPGRPNLSFQLSRKEMFSTSLQMGTTHIVARLKLDESGPTEIGGLILQPSYRGHPAKLGRFLSWVRFHFMGLYRPVVADRVLAELMGPITPDGQSTLWEYLGRRFINLTYIEADRFCQHSKEFMLNLLPREEIYLTLLPPEARRLVAQVGPETEPAKRMLEKLGFAYTNCIDPFDGGPNLEARTDSISLVKQTHRISVGDPVENEGQTVAMVSSLDDDGEFRSLQLTCRVDGRRSIRLTREQLARLGVEPGAIVGFTPIAGDAAAAPRRASANQAASGNGHGPSGKPTASSSVRKRIREGA